MNYCKFRTLQIFIIGQQICTQNFTFLKTIPWSHPDPSLGRTVYATGKKDFTECNFYTTKPEGHVMFRIWLVQNPEL